MRQIDGKFRIEDEQILNPAGVPIPDDEPLFLLRARDYLAPLLLQIYRVLSEDDNCTSYHMDGVDERIAAFKKFSEDHPERMKQPGMTMGR